LVCLAAVEGVAGVLVLGASDLQLALKGQLQARLE